jgi:hypothetical protein
MKPRTLLLAIPLLSAFSIGDSATTTVVALGAQADQRPERSLAQAVRHDTSLALTVLAQTSPQPGPDRQVPIRIPPGLAERQKPFVKRPDAVRQAAEGAALTPVPSLSFDGLSDDDNAAVLGFRVVPPDTNGDVGPNHYVQFINLILAVYDKSGGLLLGPVAGNSIWSGFGGICEAANHGDPVALYDHLADRWVLSQFAIGADGHQCVAVSATGDPTGKYHRYDFVVSPAAFNDYPKLGVWPNGYYMSANEFNGSFQGAIAVAFERSRMLRGQSAQMVKFGPLPCAAECFFSLQPSDLDGPAPARGTPNTFVMSFDDEVWGTGANSDGYRLWDFSVDWRRPENSSFTPLGQVNTTEFDANLCNFGPCVPQPMAGERLATLSPFTMYRAQYRSFADHASMLVTHTVDATGRNEAGTRWAELRHGAGGWSLYQTGTYALDDGLHRWMGSSAMDKAGNIAVGYSVSGQFLFPSIRYATRSASDPLGTLGNEVELHAGTGAQLRSFNRWGDYSSMSVAPDGCTFWYTQQYYANSARFDFKTRIGSFQVPGCTP